jgi:hypothetical protein
MTAEEIQAERAWLTHYGPHLNTLGLDIRTAVRTAAFLLACLDETPAMIEAAGPLRDAAGTVKELEDVMRTLREALARTPVLAPLPEWLSTGEFRELSDLRAYGIDTRRRGSGAGVIPVRRWKGSVFDLPTRPWR